MPLSFYYKSAILLFFFVQGNIFAILLLRKGIEHAHNASKWLSLFVFLCCLYITPWMLGHEGWYAVDGYREFLFFVPFQQLFLIGPVIYFYTQSLLNPNFQLSKKALVHFLPALVYLLYSLIIFIVDQFLLDQYYFYADGRDKDLAPWYQISGLLSMMIYTTLSIKYYYKYRQQIFQELSFADSVVFNWMQKYLVALWIMLVLRLLFLILYPEWGDFGAKWWYYFLFACLSYYIALTGYTNTIATIVSFRVNAFEMEPRPLPALQNKQVIFENKHSKMAGQVADPSLQAWKTKISDLMEKEQLYQNPTLTLSDVASTLGTTTKQVSSVINQGFGMNFNDFVNHYRVEAFKALLQRGEHQQYTILSIALACGFNSKTTFNRVFKRCTTLTPIQYVSQLKHNESNS
ncbi:MAG: AraC family transcriptional regulator [Saprospiraceae bacterium]